MTDNEIVEKVTENIKRSKCLEPFEARDIIKQKDDKVADLTKENFYLRAENERLQIELKAMRGAANSYKAEIERLTKRHYKKLDVIHNLKIDVKNAKSEAIKEFAQKVKKAFPSIAHWIDNLVKEMVEGNK